MTAPYSAAAADAVKRSFGLRSFCRATSPAWGDAIDLDIIAWDLYVDEFSIPHAKATIIVATPDAADLEMLDPREQVYIEVDVGYVYPDGTIDLHNYITLGLRACEDDPTHTTLRVSSEESFVDDDNVDTGRVGGSTVTKTYVDELIEDILTTYTNTAIVPTINNGLGNIALPSPHGMSYKPYEVRDRVEQAKKWAAAVDAVLWCDQQGVWQLQDTPTIGTPVAEIATGKPHGTMTSYRRIRTRDGGWANRVLADYVLAGGTAMGWGLVPAADTSGGTYRNKIARSEFTYTPLYASVDSTNHVSPTDPAVNELLNRTKSRGRTLRIDTVVHLWIRAGHTIRTTVRGVVEDVIVSGFHASSKGSMEITTRTPQDEE